MITKAIGTIVIVGCLAVVFFFENSGGYEGGFRVFHWPAMVLTGLGPFGIVLLCADWDRIITGVKLFFRTSIKQLIKAQEIEADALQDLSTKFYSQGARAVSDLNLVNVSPHIHKTLDRLAIRMPVSDVRELLERERLRTEIRLNQSLGLASLGLRLSPSVGMLGTILGMVQLLASLKDPANIGSHMSLALLTTFYGLFFSLIVWTPLQHRLEAIRDHQLNGFDQTLHWLELLEKRKPAHYFAEDLEKTHEA